MTSKDTIAAGLVACAVSLVASGQTAVFVEGAKQLVDSPRATAWDVEWKADGQHSIEPHKHDIVGVSLTAGAVRLIRQDASATTTPRAVGDVWFEPKGTSVREEGAPGAPTPRTVIVELKELKVPSLANTSGYSNAFPRPGAKKVLDNARVVAWDYTWTPGRPTPTHFHDKDVVVVYLEEGVLASTTPDGQVVNNPHFFGFTKFNPRDRVHTETLVKGKARAIIVELK